ncbi:hypothetical protein H7J88_05985 [Mycolicibacterium flavescens]|uniref:Uncharacterized protein n=1 Tax=Mycolicibacterium flavescens TaxID=1776 RepID=A0A1E3R6T0_MYCFV|nr:hypothetical protein [Mycolicibacterium flavescens]MCV7279193.1 hypothetical protein [Mycolicibacterium flavescens]ODQ85656.1 hypothetical protein BHQ18_28710 [Mycolicibacterium flavescens]
MTCTQSDTPCWEDSMPHFSVREKGDRITAMPLAASGMLSFFAVATFLLWVPTGAVGTLLAYRVSRQIVDPWWMMAGAALYTFLPLTVTSITTDEARNAFGQRATAKRISATPAFAGLGAGILAAAVWAGGITGAVLAIVGAGCGIAAAVSMLAAWKGIRDTRARLAWMAWLRRHGQRAPGVLREVRFLKKWSDENPLFTVVVEFATERGPQRITANMVTTRHRVPRNDSAVVITRVPGDPGAEVLIDLDPTGRPRFDPDTTKYVQPSAT